MRRPNDALGKRPLPGIGAQLPILFSGAIRQSEVRARPEERLRLILRSFSTEFPLPQLASRTDIPDLLTEEELRREMNGEVLAFDFQQDSLQKRLLEYIANDLNHPEVFEWFGEANESVKGLLKELAPTVHLGLHGANRELSELIKHCSDYEKHVLHVVVTSSRPSLVLRDPRLIQLFTRQMSCGYGENLIQYLAKRLEHRGKRSSSKKEIFNAHLVVVSRMWTFPQAPFWLMPSAAAVSIIAKILQDSAHHLSQEAYNRLTKSHRLSRLSQTTLDEFIASVSKTESGKQLTAEFEKATGVKLSEVRRGRRPTN